MSYDAREAWTRVASGAMVYPEVNIARILKGRYPRLAMDQSRYRGAKICDISTLGGANMIILRDCGFSLYGTDIDERVVAKARDNLESLGISADLRVGFNDELPFDDGFFAYLLSWNVCYYMREGGDFGQHVAEYARILEPDGYLILSIPMATHSVYDHSVEARPGYRVIADDPNDVRNGAVLKIFEGPAEIEAAFGAAFDRFVFGSVNDDRFGYKGHWYLAVCQKKGVGA